MTKHLSYDVLTRIVEQRSSSDELVWAERHLARCGVCRSEREWLERIRTAPDPFPTTPLPPPTPPPLIRSR